MRQNVLDKHISCEGGSSVEDFAGYAMLTVALGLAHGAMHGTMGYSIQQVL